jgi:methyl-accepting chemotaxis protein
MSFSNLSIRAKILGGFMVVLLIAMVIGATGYFSLGKVVGNSEINSLALSAQNKLLEAGGEGKNYIHYRDVQHYQGLTENMDDLDHVLTVLKEKANRAQRAEIGKINQLKTEYLQAASEMKRNTEENERIIQTLQNVNEDIADISRNEVQKITETTQNDIIQANSRALKENAIKEISNVVALGYDVLQIYHDKGLGREAALDAIRHMHFDGDNYYYAVQEDLTLVAHGSRRELEGQDFSIIKDKKTGKAYMLDVVGKAMANGDSVTEYFWTKPGMGNAIFPKITYAKHFKPWGLVLCAGVYVEDIDKKAAEMQALLENGFRSFQEASNIENLTLKARIDALYYLKDKLHPEKVEKALARVTDLGIATDMLKKTVERYKTNFMKLVRNDQNIHNNIQGMEENAFKTIDITNTLGQMSRKGFAESSAFGKMIILIFVAAGFLAGMGLALFLTRSITRPVQQAIQELRRSSDEVASASNQVTSASQQLAEGASEQAAAIEQTSSSLEEMSAMTKTNADNAGQADTIVRESSKDTRQAEQAMTELTASMQEISQASEETQKIVKTIDEIAFQTNLLALNAAVEAARAGEAGAGFAVVADEVRNLALRAAEAAHDTAELIEGTVKKIGNGSQFVEQANNAFTEVKTDVAKIGELVAEIAAASQEQADGIEQTAKAVAEMDKVTQQTAANAEESASASNEMTAQSEDMKHIVLELTAVVEGNSRQDVSPSTRQGKPVRSASTINHRKFRQHKSTNALPSPARSDSVDPNTVIPMDDDDFKNF